MKKIYSILTVALMLVVGAGIAYAGYKQGDNAYEAEDLEAGKLIYMKGKGQSQNKYLGVKQINSQWVLAALEENVNDNNVFELVDAQKKIDGVDAYYIKSVSANQYIGVEGNLIDEPNEYTLTLVSNVSAAQPFAIKAASESGYMVFETEWNNMTLQIDDNYVNGMYEDRTAIGVKKGDPLLILSDYFNGGSVWWDVTFAEEATDLESYLIELANLYQKAEGMKFLAGDGPGAYPTELVQAFNEAFANANVDDIPDNERTPESVKARLDALKAAIAALEEATPNPMTEGYYFIVSAMTWNDGGTKGIYTGGETVRWATYDTANPNYVWQFIEDGDGYKVKNLGQGKYIDGGNTSATVTVADETETIVSVTPASTPGAFNLGMSVNVQYSGYNILHCGGHSSGAGSQGNIVLWEASAAASQWYVLPLTAEQLEELDEVGRQTRLTNAFTSLLNQASSTYAKAVEYTGEDVTPEETAAYDSNAGMSVDHGLSWSEESSSCIYGTDGQGYSALFDKNSSTYFHTTWDSQPQDGEGVVEKHWLSIALPKAVNAIQFQMVQRGNGSWNTPSDITIEASNDGATWTVAVENHNDYDATAVNITTEPLSLGAEYTHLKLIVNHTACKNSPYADISANGGIFWNLSGLRIIANPSLVPSCQAATMPAAVVDGLKQAIATAKAIDKSKVTQADIDALQAAYNAFVAQFADPTAFKAMLADAKTMDALFLAEDKIGANGAGAQDPLASAISDAEAFLNSAYDASSLAAAEAKLTAAIAAFKAQLIRPQTNTWYRIRVSDEETKAKYNWTYPEAAYNGKVMTVAADLSMPLEPTEVPAGANMYAISKEDAEATGADDCTLFRFINCGDSAFVIQSKTGKYLRGGTTGSGMISLQNIPTLYKVTPLGAGQNLIKAYNIVTGQAMAEIHLDKNGYFVSWDAGAINTRSAFEIEAADVEFNEDEIGNTSMNVQAGAFTTVTLCSSLSGIDGADILTPMGRFMSDDVMFMGFQEEDAEEFVAKAGEPFILLPPGDYSPEATEEDQIPVYFKLGSELSNVAHNVNGLQGTYSTINAPVGSAILQTNASGEYVAQWNVVTASTSNKRVAAQTAFLQLPGDDITSIPEIDETEADVIMPIIGGSLTDIKTVVKALKVQRAYTLDGVQVDVNKLQRGRIYIMDGRKVLIP